MKESIVIANASGFWGDEGAAIKRQIEGGRIDYLTGDYLAEITMIILARQKEKNPQAGYARDFVQTLSNMLQQIEEKGITVITNAGGINPSACAEALEAVIAEKGLQLPVAVIDGDDLMPRLPDMLKEGCPFSHMDSGESLAGVADRVISANAYIGARPIVAALQQGARIVVTGRTYDAASVVAPIIHEFGWAWEDYDRLAAALLAGHLIECGTQSTGGNYSLWQEVPSFSNMGYPLVEVNADGSFYLTKHPGTGGLVSLRTAKEQILYEIGNPHLYMSPDVIADFTSFTLEDAGPDRVFLKNVRGQRPTPHLKVSVTYEAGHKIAAMLVVSGPDVIAKAQKFAEMFWERVGTDFTERRTDFVGYSACWGESAAPRNDPNEIILRFAARSHDKSALQKMSREIAGLILAGPPGVTVFGGRPRIQPAYGFWPAIIPRELVTARLIFKGAEVFFNCGIGEFGEPVVPEDPPEPVISGRREKIKVPLSAIAHARSGDKGDICNIGVAALESQYYPELLRELTPEKVAAYFSTNVHGQVSRYRLDNLNAMNFILRDALDGGGTVSLLLDNQGKTLSQALLNMPVEISRELLSDVAVNN
jgi:Acyclic terpene utilisation family protein AtuA